VARNSVSKNDVKKPGTAAVRLFSPWSIAVSGRKSQTRALGLARSLSPSIAIIDDRCGMAKRFVLNGYLNGLDCTKERANGETHPHENQYVGLRRPTGLRPANEATQAIHCVEGLFCLKHS